MHSGTPTAVAATSGSAAREARSTNVAWRIDDSAYDDIVILRGPHARQPQPSDWRDRLEAALRAMPGVAAVGAKRLDGRGMVFSMGEFVVHPKGFHHLGRGVRADAYRFPEEVDVISGGVMAVRRDAFEHAGGRDALRNGLGAMELCLTLRREALMPGGGRCVVVPEVIVEDESAPLRDGAGREAFMARWGFDWQVADLDAVRTRHAGTGLLWNVRYHGRAMAFEKYQQRPAVHWSNYREVDVYRQRADHLVKLVADAARLAAGGADADLSTAGTVLDLGCGDGLFSHLLALQGCRVVGVDPELTAIDQARAQIAGETYTTDPPMFVVGGGESLAAVTDAPVATVAMLDVIEHLPNPAAVLAEVGRRLRPAGTLVISTPAWQYGAWSDPLYHVTEYTMTELIDQVEAAGPFRVVNQGKIGGVYRDLIVIARRNAS